VTKRLIKSGRNEQKRSRINDEKRSKRAETDEKSRKSRREKEA